jgi:hypothetical protein
VLVIDAGWERVPERLVNEAEVGVSTVGIPARKTRRDAQILRSASAEPAAAVGTAQPSDTDTITASKPASALAKRIDNADYLVTRRDIRMLGN